MLLSRGEIGAPFRSQSTASCGACRASRRPPPQPSPAVPRCSPATAGRSRRTALRSSSGCGVLPKQVDRVAPNASWCPLAAEARALLRPIGVLLLQVSLENRHRHERHCCLRVPILQAPCRKRRNLPRLLHGHQHPPRRLRAVGTGLQVPHQFPEQLPHAVRFDAGDRFSVHSGSPVIPAHGLPRGIRDLFPSCLVAQRVEAELGFLIRFRV